MILDAVEVLGCVLDCNNTCGLDVVFRKQNVVLRCFKTGMMCYMTRYDQDGDDDVRFGEGEGRSV